MMFLIAVLVTFSLVFSSSSESNGVDLKNFTKETNVAELWKLYKTTYNKHYGEENEAAKRYDIFADNVKKIIEHNEEYDKGLSTYKMGLNAFSDYTAEEFRAFRGVA
ncbi:Cathepsin L-like proteinase [Pseudolycoriella hygida]|uniref:Cathepsin L-like proteinase n=1 Tax=Pseudolycoriella hygida TaxID=35572 RepID=A0A9Q0MYK5_9DIPT|nr:Cathepsin L-like proteinase [Pseudolycoriella hygida]